MLPPTADDISIDNPACNEQFDQLPTTVYDCVQKLASALDARESSFLNSEQLNAALNDATAVMTFVPWSPIGYLHAGNIYALRGQHYSAIRVYEQAMHNVSRMDSRYQQLVTAKKSSYGMVNKRMDFVSSLPLEVVTSNLMPRILRHQALITIGEEEGYLNVCSTWRQRIAMTDGLEFVMVVMESPHLEARDYHHIQDVAPYIKSLTMLHVQGHIVSTLAERFKLQALKSLYIGANTSQDPGQLPVALHSLSPSLTQLHIDYGFISFCQTGCSLYDLLDACPHLVALSISQGQLDTPSTSTTYPKLKKLELINTYTTADVESLLRPFPQLQVLRLPPTTSAALFPIIDQVCPRLQQLTRSYKTSIGFPNTVQDFWGLHVLSVSHAANFLFAQSDALMQYMMKHCGTLEIIELECNDTILPPITERHIPTLTGVTFEQLREIRYAVDICEGHLPWILWMIRHAPRLESVETVYGSRQSPVMHELLLPYHEHFKRIGMFAGVTAQWREEQFIQHHVAKGLESNLKEISLRIGEHSVSDSWIPLIAQLVQLTYLEVFCEANCDQHMVASSFIPAIATGCPALERFTFVSEHYQCHYDDIVGMSAHTNLKTLSIVAHFLGGDPRVLVEAFQKLHVLHLRVGAYQEEDLDILDNGSFQLVYHQGFNILH